MVFAAFLALALEMVLLAPARRLASRPSLRAMRMTGFRSSLQIPPLIKALAIDFLYVRDQNSAAPSETLLLPSALPVATAQSTRMASIEGFVGLFGFFAISHLLENDVDDRRSAEAG